MPIIPPLPTGGEVIESWDRNGTSCYYFFDGYKDPRDGRPACFKYEVNIVVIRQPAKKHHAPRVTATSSRADFKVAAEHAAAIKFEPVGCLWTRWDRANDPRRFEKLDAINDGWRFPKPE